MVPAMDGGMWEHAAVAANVVTLRRRGVTVLEPDTGALASGLSGKGRFPEIDDIVEALRRLLVPTRDLAGERLLVTAGPTREPIDPVRYISNRSSGKMGYGLATAALRRGAEVTLVSGPTALTPPAGAVFVPVQTAEEMREAVLHHLDRATIVVKAAAVADYRARQASTTKIKGKHDLTLELTPNADILAEVAARRPSAFVVGFAAETHDVAANARAKLERKGIDLLVANDVSQQGIGFDAEDNEVLLLDRWGGRRALARMPKGDVADAILSRASPAPPPPERRPPSPRRPGPARPARRALGALGDSSAITAISATDPPVGGDICSAPPGVPPVRRLLQGCRKCKLRRTLHDRVPVGQPARSWSSSARTGRGQDARAFRSSGAPASS
jgi:phosphopantothenoylcysteine decarboxylase/phosphopantothenate--cysteine ligase